MPVPLPRSARSRSCSPSRPPFLRPRLERDGVAGGALYTQTNDPNGNAVQRFDRAPDGSLTPAGHVRDRRRRPRHARRAPGRRRAQRRRPLPVRRQRRLGQRVGVPHRPRRHPAGRHRRARAASRRRASPSTAAASTSSTPAARRTSPRSGARSTARCGRSGGTRELSAGRRRRRAGLGHAGRALAGGQRAGRQPARDAAARPPRPPRQRRS